MPIMLGAPLPAKPANDEVRNLCQMIRTELEEKLKTKFSVYDPISFRTQVVAGTNYFVKIHVGDGKHVHVRVFKPLFQEAYQLHNFQDNKLAEDSIDYF